MYVGSGKEESISLHNSVTISSVCRCFNLLYRTSSKLYKATPTSNYASACHPFLSRLLYRIYRPQCQDLNPFCRFDIM